MNIQECFVDVGDMILTAYTAGDLPRAVVIRSAYKQMLGLNPGDDESVLDPLDNHCNEALFSAEDSKGQQLFKVPHSVRFAIFDATKTLIRKEYDIADIVAAMPDMIEELRKVTV